MNNSAHNDDSYQFYMESRSGCFDEEESEDEDQPEPGRGISLGMLGACCAIGVALWLFLIRVGILIWRLL